MRANGDNESPSKFRLYKLVGFCLFSSFHSLPSPFYALSKIVGFILKGKVVPGAVLNIL